jgi:hypothetical protein
MQLTFSGKPDRVVVVTKHQEVPAMPEFDPSPRERSHPELIDAEVVAIIDGCREELEEYSAEGVELMSPRVRALRHLVLQACGSEKTDAPAFEPPAKLQLSAPPSDPIIANWAEWPDPTHAV